MGDNLSPIDLGSGRTAKSVASGFDHTCVLLDNDTVKCFGKNTNGQLGQGHTRNLGDDEGEMGNNLPAINLGTGRIGTSISVGVSHTCALLDNDSVKCWGSGAYGMLGQGHTNDIGDDADEMGNNLPTVDLGKGRTATVIAPGEWHTCALLDKGSVKCWGWAAHGRNGQGNSLKIGDEPDEMGKHLIPIDLGTGRTAIGISVGTPFSCALLDNGTVKCWGIGSFGQLGQGNTTSRGDGPDEMGDNLATIDLGTDRTATNLTSGRYHTCTALDDGTTKCWGWGANGRLGQEDTDDLGDEPGEMGDNLTPIDLGTSISPSTDVLGTLAFKNGTSTASDAVSYGTNDITSLGAIVAVHVADADLLTSNNTSKVTSDSDGTGITVPLISRASGKASGLFVIGTSTGTTTVTLRTGQSGVVLPMLKTAHGDTITATYTDETTSFGTVGIPKTMTVDANGPTFLGMSPASGTITKTAAQTYSISIKDTDSGVNETAGTYGFLINTSSATTTGLTLQSPLSTADYTEGGTKVGVTISIPLSLTGNVWISARATDVAGNSTDASSIAKITIDQGAPTLTSVYTGVDYAASAPRTLGIGNKKSLMVIFADPGSLTKLDGNSVTAGDFAVANNSVSSADVFASATASSTSVTGMTPGDGGVDTGLAVFLTLGSDMAAGDTPAVTVIGTITDEAGNVHVSTGAITPNDRIAPTLTVSGLTPTLAGVDATVSFTITADEAVTGDEPATITVYNLEDSTALTRTVAAGAGDTWTVTTAALAKSGTHSIYVAATDSAANAGTTGVTATTTAGVGATGIIEFESDVSLVAPLVSPATGASQTTRNPFFVTIDFSNAGTTTVGASESVEFTGDSNKGITFTTVELDGVDVSDGVSSEDNNNFLLALNDITSAEHTLTFNAEDEAGNALAADQEIVFTITDRPQFSIALKPGWNLISLPADPADGAINTVFTGLDSVSDIVTYDLTIRNYKCLNHVLINGRCHAVPGGALSASRDDAGTLVGTLEAITSKAGYWVYTTKFKTLTVTTQHLAAGQTKILPPSIPIVKGWNLISVVDVTGTKAGGDTIAASAYLASIFSSVTRVYTFDTVGNEWSLVDHPTTKITAGTGDDNMTFGKGYFIYATEAGTLVP